MSIMGVNIDYFDIPVCTSFEATVLNDQLCYEVDLNRFSNHKDMKSNLESGFIFLMDYNEDRQVAIYNESSKLEEKSFANRVVKSDHENHASIILNTIGAAISYLIYKNLVISLMFNAEPVKLIGEGEYNLNVLNEIKVTDSYLGLDSDIIRCQNKEYLHNCTTRQYINTLLDQCGCLPFNIRRSDEV